MKLLSILIITALAMSCISTPEELSGKEIVIDGNLSDWNNSEILLTDKKGDSLAGNIGDLKSISIEIDNENLYILVRTFSSSHEADDVIEIDTDFIYTDGTYHHAGINVRGNESFSCWIDSNGNGNIDWDTDEKNPVEAGGTQVHWNGNIEIRYPLYKVNQQNMKLKKDAVSYIGYWNVMDGKKTTVDRIN